MTTDNFPPSPLTVSQRTAFNEASTAFRQRVFSDHLKKAGWVIIYFLITLLMAGYFTSLAKENLNFWNGLRAIIADVLLALPPWIYLMAHLADGGYRRDEKAYSDHFYFSYVCTPDSLSACLGVSRGGWKKIIAEAMAKQETFFIALVVACLAVGCAIAFMMQGAVAWFILALVIAAGSVWNLLGWLVWFKPVEVMRGIYWRSTAPPESHLDGSYLVTMPTASCSSPIAPPSPIPPGDYLDGKVTLNPDGNYLAGGVISLDQGTTCEQSEFMGLKVTKKEAGEGKEILFEAGGKVLRAEFSQGQWYQL